MQCTFADRYRHFKGTCCHHILPCRWRRGISAKYCCLSTNFCGSISQKTVIIAFTAVRASNFILHLWMLNNEILKYELQLSLCSLHHTLWGITSHIHTLCNRQTWMVSFMPKPLYPWGESHQYPSARRLCGVQRWSSYFGEKKILLTLLAMEPWISDCPAYGLVTIPNNYRCNNIPLKCNNEENWEQMWHAWTISLKSSSWLTLALTSR